MRFGNRPPFASESLLGDQIEQNAREPELPEPPGWDLEYAYTQCQCKLSSPRIVDSYELPSDGSVRLIRCECCRRKWKELHEG